MTRTSPVVQSTRGLRHGVRFDTRRTACPVAITFAALLASQGVAWTQEIPRAEAAQRSTRRVVGPPSTAAASSALGGDTPKTPIHFVAPGGGTSSATRSGFYSSTVILFGMIAAVGIISFVAKRRPGMTLKSLPGNVLHVLGRQSLGGGQSLVLIRLGERVLLCGASTDGLRTLMTVDDPVEAASLIAECLASLPQPLNLPRRTPAPASVNHSTIPLRAPHSAAPADATLNPPAVSVRGKAENLSALWPRPEREHA